MKNISKELFLGLIIELIGIGSGLLISDKIGRMKIYALVAFLALILFLGYINSLKPKVVNSKPILQKSQWNWIHIVLASVGWGLSIGIVPLLVSMRTYDGQNYLTGDEFASVILLFSGLTISLITWLLLKSINLQLGIGNIIMLFVGWGGGFSLPVLVIEELRLDFFTPMILEPTPLYISLMPTWLVIIGLICGPIMTGVVLNTVDKRINVVKTIVVILGWLLGFGVGALFWMISDSFSYIRVSSTTLIFANFILGTIIGFIGNLIMYSQVKKIQSASPETG